MTAKHVTAHSSNKSTLQITFLHPTEIAFFHFSFTIKSYQCESYSTSNKIHITHTANNTKRHAILTTKTRTPMHSRAAAILAECHTILTHCIPGRTWGGDRSEEEWEHDWEMEGKQKKWEKGGQDRCECRMPMCRSEPLDWIWDHWTLVLPTRGKRQPSENTWHSIMKWLCSRWICHEERDRKMCPCVQLWLNVSWPSW